MLEYGLSKSELIAENKHITSWEKLVPGTKLKIPAISENNELGIIEMEPFIEDYYPPLSLPKEVGPLIEKVETDEGSLKGKEETDKITPKIESISNEDNCLEDKNDNYEGYYYPYYYYPTYYSNQNYRYPVYYPVYVYVNNEK